MATTKKTATKSANEPISSGAKKKTAQIIGPKLSKVTVHLRGVGDGLLMNRFSEEAMRSMLDKMEGKVDAAKKKDPLDLHAKFLQSFHMIKGEPTKKGAMYGIPARAVKQMICSAGTYFNRAVISKTKLYGSIFVHGTDRAPSGESMIRLINHSAPKPFFAIGRSQGMTKSPLPCNRALFEEWEIKFALVFDETQVSLEAVMSVVARAGLSIGLLSWSPRLQGGNFGQCELVSLG